MEDLNQTIVSWINKNNLTKKCETLSDLSDGIILFELLSQVSQEIFDVASITLDIQNNWALKLANLRRLKKAIDNYLTNQLKIPYVQFNEIRLGSIARKNSTEDIIKFLELVFFVIVNCPQKEVYIRRIMELDEQSQYCLMLFIKKAMGDSSDDLMQDSEFSKKEIEILKNEKNNLAEQLSEYQAECIKLREARDSCFKENEELKISLIELQIQSKNYPNRTTSETTEVAHRLEKKLAEKTVLLQSCQELLNETKAKFEKEVGFLRDELDIALNKNFHTRQSEKVIESYKKKVEKMTAMKKKMIELKRSNENMEKLIIEHQNEIETYQQYKKSSIFYKEEYMKEKEKNSNILAALESKEKQIIKLNKTIVEMSDKILYQENRIHELEIPLDASFVSEGSFNFGKIEPETENRRASRHLLVPYPTSSQPEALMKELTVLKSSLNKKKAGIVRLKETLSMQNEEILCKNYNSYTLITQLSSRNNAMADRLQFLSEDISNCENEKEKLKQTTYELISLKNNKEQLLSEIKNLYEEKDIIYKKYIAGREEVITLNSRIHELEILVRDLELNLKLQLDKVKSYETSKKAVVKKNPNENLQEKIERLEQLNKELTRTSFELEFRIKEKESKIEDLIKAKAESLKNLENDRLEAVNRLKHEFEWKSEQMVRQTEEALFQIQKEKDELQSRLAIEKKNNLMEWKKAMILKDPSLISVEENNKLKLNVAELEKENEKLLRTNQELTICWKESARMLKNVSKLVECETKRMQKIMVQKP